jgi:NADH-quinone oxidoreductase subunit I
VTGSRFLAPPRGVIALLEENRTLCARVPTGALHRLALGPVEVPGGRARQRNVLDRFAIDFALMYCGIAWSGVRRAVLVAGYAYARGTSELLRAPVWGWLASVPPRRRTTPTGTVEAGVHGGADH